MSSSPVNTQRPGKISDFELREIFRKRAIQRGIDRNTAEDVAQEMFTMALANERARGVSRFDQNAKWLFASACANVFFRSDNKKKSGWIKLSFGDHPSYGAANDGYPLFSQERFEQWLCANWAPTSNRHNATFIKKYKVMAGGVEVEFSGQDLKELLGKTHLNIRDCDFVANLRKRGKRMFLIDGHLWRELQDACEHYRCVTKTLKKRFEIQEVKIWVV